MLDLVIGKLMQLRIDIFEIPLNRCFIINPSSEVVQLGHTTKTTYQEIADNVDKDFPKLSGEEKSENTDIKSNMNLINEDDNNNIISSQLDNEGNTITIKTGENE